MRSSSQLFPPNLGLFLVSRLRIMWLFEVSFSDYSSLTINADWVYDITFERGCLLARRLRAKAKASLLVDISPAA